MKRNSIKYTLGICDNDCRICEMLREMIEKIFISFGDNVKIEVFYSGQAFIEYLKKGIIFDFVILDIGISNPDGISIGKMIRDEQENLRTQIIYISSNVPHNTEVFSVQPLDFLFEPISYDAVKKIITRGKRFLGNSEEFFCFQKGREINRITYKKIIYLYSQGRQIYMITTEGEISFYGHIKDIQQNLPSFFQRIHQSYIINVNMVRECTYSEVIMLNGTHLNISRPYRDDIRKKIINTLTLPQL